MSDLPTLSDEELHAARVDVIAECDRRLRLDAIPAQIAQLAAAYAADGGDTADLVTIITEGTTA